MSLIEASLGRTRTVLSLLVLLLITGLYAYNAIPKESEPDINVPIIYVSMFHRGISPDDAERLLVRPMEKELASIEGVKEMTSRAYQDGGSVMLEFTAGFDSDQALLDVREAVDKGKAELPEETEEPTVNEVNFSLFPVLVVTLSGDVPERALIRLARDLQDKVEAVASVLEANIAGDREEMVEMIIDPTLVESYGLQADEVISLFARSNQLVAAGNLHTDNGSFTIKVPGLFEEVDDIMAMPVKVSGDSVVRLRDIASIRSSFHERTSIARRNGKPAIALEVVKRTGENVIDTIDAVKEVVEAERKFWPENVVISYSQDKSETIKEMLRDLQNNVISAIILVMIVVVAAMGLRTSLLVGVSVPGSFLTGILFLYLSGFTVNVVVLFALILSTGMLVDGAVVVTEFADRKMSEGLHKAKAYAIAAKRMAWPIIASTATTLVAFLPLLFWPGIVGEFMMYLPMTLIAVLTASLAMALIFVPTLGALFGKPGTSASPEVLAALSASETGDIHTIKGMTGRYISILEKALSHPKKVMLIAVAMLIGVQIVYANFGKGIEFFPEIEPENAVVLVHARGNLSIEEQDVLVKEVESHIMRVPGVESVYTRVGSNNRSGDDVAEDVIGQVQLEFVDWQLRRKASAILDEVRQKTSNIAGIKVELREEQQGPNQGKDIEVEIAARDPSLLDDAVLHIRSAMENAIGGLVDIEDSRSMPGIEWEVDVDRAQAAKFGLDITTIGSSIRLVTNGLLAGTYRPDTTDDEVDIVARYPEDKRSIMALSNLHIQTRNGSIPVSNFLTIKPKQRVSTLNRADQARVMRIFANVAEGENANAKTNEMKRWLSENPVTNGVRVSFKGQDEDQREAQEFLTKAFFVALFLMAIILLTQFNSFYSAFLILTAVILSTIGVFLGLLITGQAFSVVMTGVGVISLAGIVVNNNIVLIDTYDYIRATTDYSVREAIVRTCAQRFRPVMLTTITTILGLLPMVLQINIDFVARDVSIGAPSTQWWVQLATAVAYGLTFATVLTLLVTPALLQLRGNASNWWHRQVTSWNAKHGLQQ